MLSGVVVERVQPIPIGEKRSQVIVGVKVGARGIGELVEKRETIFVRIEVSDHALWRRIRLNRGAGRQEQRRPPFGWNWITSGRNDRAQQALKAMVRVEDRAVGKARSQ